MTHHPSLPAIDVRVAGLPARAAIRIAGLDEATIHQVERHWSAEVARVRDDTDRPAAVRVERLGEPPRDRLSRTITSDGDLVSLPGGRLRVHPERDEVVAALADGGEALALDVLDAAMAIALARRGVLLLHAAAFRHGRTGVVAVGASGSGKSTLAAAALRAGGRIVSDDTVLVHTTRGSLRVHPFRSHLGFREEPTGTLPPAAAQGLRTVTGTGWTWWRLDLGDLPPSSRLAACAPDRLWVLSVDRRLGRSRGERLPQSEILAALVAAASPLVLSPRYRTTRSRLMPVLLAAAESCPAWRVRLGTELVRDPAAELERLIDVTS